MTVASSAKIYPGIRLGKNVTIEDFCIIGSPFKGMPLDCETYIGDNSIIRSHTVIYAGNKIGKNFQTGNKANIRELNTIGDNVSIGTLSVIEHHVEIGDGVRIHSQAFIPEFSRLEENVWIGPNVVFTNALYPCSSGVKESLKGPLIRKNSIVGANSTLLPGVELGERSLVGAGTVVTKDVNNNSVCVGNPSREIKNIQDLPYDQ